jgi:hypothetical protein
MYSWILASTASALQKVQAKVNNGYIGRHDLEAAAGNNPMGNTLAVVPRAPSIGPPAADRGDRDSSRMTAVDAATSFADMANMKYDSTGMFHWCSPRNIDECLLVASQFLHI